MRLSQVWERRGPSFGYNGDLCLISNKRGNPMNKRRLCAMLAVAAVLLAWPLWGLQLAVWVWNISDQGRPMPTPTPYSLPPGYLDEIQWLPNGEGVVVSHARKIYLVGADGSKRRLDEGNGHLHNSLMISIHPSSSHVAYLSNSGTGWHDSYRTWIAELQPGYERYHLGNLESFDDGFHSTWPDHFPAWSPDATQVAFFDEGVLRTAPAGATPSNIGELVSKSEEVALCTGSCRALVWSPDGRRLAFTGEQDDEPEATHRENEQWTEELEDFRRLASNRVSLADVYEGRSFQFDVIGGHTPSWSPDGQLLAFAGWNTDIEPSIYTVNADGSNLRTMHGIPWQPGRAHSTLEFYYWKAPWLLWSNGEFDLLVSR